MSDSVTTPTEPIEGEKPCATTDSGQTPTSESATSEHGTIISGESETAYLSVEAALVAAQEAIWPPMLREAPSHHIETARAALRRDAPRLIDALRQRGIRLTVEGEKP